MKIKLFVICLLLFSTQIFAESKFTWELISTSVGGDKYYGDRKSIRKNSSGNYIVWTLNNGSDGKSTIFSEEYDCNQLRYRWLYIEFYTNHYGEGRKTASFNTEKLKSMDHGEWVYPKPNSNNDHKVNWVCKN
tara:strand:- start:1084 stop:1482 length:399 start_codon:yes stop_codon:yes gene_type:complete